MNDFFTKKQEQDIAFFNENLEKWVDDPLMHMKYAVISDKVLHNTFDTFENALNFAVSKFQPREYIIQQIISSTEITGFLYSAFSPAQETSIGIN
jgi:hypothetical protein